MNRREFVKAGFVGVVAAVLHACGVRETPAPTATTAPTAKPSVTPPGATPGASPTVRKILANDNREGFYVRYFNPFPAPDRQAWRLQVQGLVDEPQEFDYEAVLNFPSTSQVSRMKCVECWSAKAKWEGFTYETLADIVKPSSQATHVRFECVDGYYEVVSIEELSQPRVLFVLKMNDRLLPDEYGSPLRMIFPSKYGYKGAKAVNVLRFQDKPGRGYWSSVGPYTVSGDIEPGFDRPLDIPDGVRQIGGGEITEY